MENTISIPTTDVLFCHFLSSLYLKFASDANGNIVYSNATHISRPPHVCITITTTQMIVRAEFNAIEKYAILLSPKWTVV